MEEIIQFSLNSFQNIPKGEWFCEQCELSKEKEERRDRLSEAVPKKKQRLLKEEDTDALEKFQNGEDSNDTKT